MADISPITYDMAQSYGHQLFQLGVTQWGNVGAGADATSGGITLPYGIVGAEVHPRSEIEGFRLRWTRPFPEQPAIIVPPDTINIRDFFVMRDKPFVGRLTGPVAILPLPQDYYGDLYIPAGQGASQLFGGSMVAPTVFDAPELWAALWIREESRNIGVRHHYRIGPTTNTLTGFGTIDTVFALPVAGRKNIRIIFTSIPVPGSPDSVARAVNLRISGIAGNNTGVGFGLDNRLQEYEIQSVHVSDRATVMVTVPYTPHQWLLVKAEVEETAPGAISWRVDASDYP